MMGQAWLMTASLLVGLFPAYGLSQTGQVDSSSDNNTENGFAVVELFTSQGCSSCPPADRVLADLADSIDDDQPVYLLSFHVDYWNQLGWEDPYSLPISTARQKAYARAWSSRRVYTPQMVVNGTWEFNGGNKDKARLAIDEGLSKSAMSEILLQPQVDGEGTTAIVAYKIEGQIDDHLLNVALVSPELANEVPRGENRGRKLRHVNVVRSFATQALRMNEGEVELSIPPDFEWETGSAIAYVQRRGDAILTGATAQPLKKR